MATCSSTTKYALSTFLKGRERKREREGRKERMEWAQYIIRSEKDHFVPSVRKEIANSMLAEIFISPSSVGCSVPGYSTWENKRYIRSTTRSFPPPYPLVLFFKSISKRIHDRTCGLSVDRTTFTFYRVPIHRLPSETRQRKGKKDIMAATEIVSLILNRLFLPSISHRFFRRVQTSRIILYRGSLLVMLDY